MAVIPSPFPSGGGSSLPDPVTVPHGGTGDASVIAYTPIVGGTTSTNAFQSVAALNTLGMPLSSQGAAAIPAFTPATAPVTALTDAATIAVNAALGNYFTVTIGASRTMGAPSNPVDGQFLLFAVKQGGAGSFTITWTSGAGGYSFGAGSAPTLTTTAGATDLIGFRWSAIVGKALFQGSQLGFS